MSVLFLFPEVAESSECLSVLLDDQGDFISPLQLRPWVELQPLSLSQKTLVVLPSTQFSFHRVALPLLNDKKAQAAIPYALEDQIAQPLMDVHIAFSQAFYTQGQYLALICDQAYLQNILLTLVQYQIQFTAITVDWFALKPGETALAPNAVYMHSDLFSGAWQEDALLDGLAQTAHPVQVWRFLDTSLDKVSHFPEASHIDALFNIWCAQRLLNQPYINLCQGVFKQKTHRNHHKQMYYLAGGLFAVWFLSKLLFNGYQILSYMHKNNQLDEKIAVVYRQFFPGAKQIISPKFRISRWLSGDQQASESGFWILMSHLASALDLQKVHIEQFNWQNHTLKMKLLAADFNHLDALQTRLRQRQIRVIQKQVATENHQVMAHLELSL